MSFAPGHISLTFAIWENDDEMSKGSTGIGLVVPQGVHCAIEKSKAKKNIVIRKGEEIDDLVTLRAVELLGFKDQGLVIYQRLDLPLGSGFGISGASALAACLELERDIDKCVEASHKAEVEYNTGLGDVVAIAESLRNTRFPSVVIRETPGFRGKVTCKPIKEKFVVCISGLGRNTSDIISDKNWVEIINSAALGINYNSVSLRSAIKIGRLFTERTGLINENTCHVIDRLPLDSVSTVAHLGTSIVATSDNIPMLVESLQEFGAVREY